MPFAHKIPIDFVAGSHGNFLETVCNHGFGIVSTVSTFNALGASHNKTLEYTHQKIFDARHWFLNYPAELSQYPKVIRISFCHDDLLLLSSLSMLRAGDANIDNDQLESNTITKLSNKYYQDLIQQIRQAYPFLDTSANSIPRYVLREFYKFGFRDPERNGYWLGQQQMKYPASCSVFEFEFGAFYNIDRLVSKITDLANFLDAKFNFDDVFYQRHETFLKFIPYLNHKQQCDQIIDCIVKKVNAPIPKLSLFQESYINGNLEKIFQKEMPFHQENYFTSTQDVLYYLDNQASNL